MKKVAAGPISYDEYENEISLLLRYGPMGVKIAGKKFEPMSWGEYILNYASVAFSKLFGGWNKHTAAVVQLAEKKIRKINDKTDEFKNANEAGFNSYVAAKSTFERWNSQFEAPKSQLERLKRCALSSLGMSWRSNLEDYLQIDVVQPVEISQFNPDLFSCHYLNDQKLPLVVTPLFGGADLNFYQKWYDKKSLKSALDEHGAVLFRGFSVNSADAFASFIKVFLQSEPISYHGGEGSRDKVAEGVYTSTKAPSWAHIHLHNELSCTDNPIKYINFFCETPPEAGTGQTILGSTAGVTDAIKKKPDLWNLFEGRTIKYVSRHPPEGSFFNRVNATHKTWQECFETDDKAKVEEICKSKGFKFKWIPSKLFGEWIEVTRRAPATKINAEGGKDWFNQAHLYYSTPKRDGGWLNYILASLLYIIPWTRNYDVSFDDEGPQFSKKIMDQVHEILEKETVKFNWQKGDVLVVNNFKALHGKAPHKGPRSILTSMIQ